MAGVWRTASCGVAAGLIVIATVAGCGSASSTSKKASGQTTGSSALKDVEAAYTTTTGAKSAKVTLTETITASSSSGSSQTEKLTGSGVVELGGADNLQLSINAPSGGSTQIRETNGVEYTREPPADVDQVPGHKHWVEVNVASIDKAVYGKSYTQLATTSGDDPAGVLASLERVSDGVKKTGSTTLAGVPVSEYQASVDLDKVASKAGGKEEQAIRQEATNLGSHVIPVTIWVDAQHRVRQLREMVALPPASSGATNGKGHAAITLEFSQFGTPVHVTAPPSSQTTNLTAQSLRETKAALG